MKWLQRIILLICLSVFTGPFWTGWNHKDHCVTSIPIPHLISMNRYVSCCLLAYQLPKSDNYYKLIEVFQLDRLVSYEAFYHENEHCHVAGYIMKFPDEFVITFRGTVIDGKIRSELWNNLYNCLVPKSIGNFCFKVHKGVWKEYKYIFSSLMETWNKMLSENCDSHPKNIVFTGHSIGGNICQLAALDFFSSSNPSKKIIQCVTFGSYKMFDDPLLFQKLGIENIRVRFQNDLVTRYPLSKNFHHVGTRDVVFYHHRQIEHRIIYYKRYIQRLLNQSSI